MIRCYPETVHTGAVPSLPIFLPTTHYPLTTVFPHHNPTMTETLTEPLNESMIADQLRTASPATGHASRSAIHDPRSTVHDPRLTVPGPRFTVHDPRSPVHDSRLNLSDMSPVQSVRYVPGSICQLCARSAIRDSRFDLSDMSPAISSFSSAKCRHTDPCVCPGVSSTRAP